MLPLIADYVVVGAGIVGLAIARELRKRHPHADILIFEKEAQAGRHASTRNSGVLHSGIYYPPQSLKAKVCSRGAELMKRFARDHRVALTELGKVIVATSDDEIPALEKLIRNARENNIVIEELDEAGIRKYEPHAAGKRGVMIPSTAVIDSTQVIEALVRQLKAERVEFYFEQGVSMISPKEHELRARNLTCRFRYLVNAAGAHADRVAEFFGCGQNYVLVPFKGIYYQLRLERASLIRSNLYPVPDSSVPFLGIHFTKMPSGEVHVGPTAIPALGRENYGVLQGFDWAESMKIFPPLLKLYFGKDPKFKTLVHSEVMNYFKACFYARARKLIPELRQDDLIPFEKTGIRPQLIRRDTHELEMDYVIEQTENSIHILNAISPAFTSSFAFAELVVDRLEGK